MKTNPFVSLLGLLLAGGLALAQAPSPQIPPVVTPVPANPTGQADLLRPTYVLQPEDQILVRAREMEEVGDRAYRIEADNFVNLPILGKVLAGGLTVERFEASLLELLKKYVKQPLVTVTVVQYSSEPVFFVGAFHNPGIHPLSGRHTLVETISTLGGGLDTNASHRIRVTRRKEFGMIPLASAIPTPDGAGSTIEVSLATLQGSINPAEDIVLKPFDIISVDKAEQVYVSGEIAKAGALDLQEKDTLSLVQVISLSGGVTATGNPRAAVILRPIMNTSRRAQIPVNIEKILAGTANDVPLLPNDVLFIPKAGGFSSPKMTKVLPAVSLVATLALLARRF